MNGRPVRFSFAGRLSSTAELLPLFYPGTNELYEMSSTDCFVLVSVITSFPFPFAILAAPVGTPFELPTLSTGSTLVSFNTGQGSLFYDGGAQGTSGPPGIPPVLVSGSGTNPSTFVHGAGYIIHG